MFIKRPFKSPAPKQMTPPPDIESAFLTGILSRSSLRPVDNDQVKIETNLHLAEGSEFYFLVIGDERAKTSNPDSFAIRVFLKLPSGRFVTIIEHLHIQASDCGIEPHVATWCEDKTLQRLELLANFVAKYLYVEIEESENGCCKFTAAMIITQESRSDSWTRKTRIHMSVTKPIQDLHGFFATSPASS